MSTTIPLKSILDEKVNSDDLYLPVFPALALQLQAMMSSDEVSIEALCSKIGEDQALVTELLRASNSAFYSGLSEISTIKDAIMRLGTRQATNIILLAAQRPYYGSGDKVIQPYLVRLWKHAGACAMGSNWLAQRLGYGAVSQEAFLAGLLHDIGNLFLLKVLEDLRRTTDSNIQLSTQVLNEILESMHTSHGAKLMERWNLPATYCDIVRQHHGDSFDPGNTLLIIVRLVNMACHKLGIGLHEDSSIMLAATAEAHSLEVSELLAAELEIMLEDCVATTI